MMRSKSATAFGILILLIGFVAYAFSLAMCIFFGPMWMIAPPIAVGAMAYGGVTAINGRW